MNIPVNGEKPSTTENNRQEQVLENKPRVILLVPHYSETIYTRASLSIMGQLRFANEGIIMPESSSKSLAEIRNELTEHALKTNATHFLWLDGDELFPQHMTPQLLKHDKDIVGAWTVIRQEHIPNVYKMTGQWKHEPFEGKELEKVDRMGFGSILIKREVFEKIPYPWFAFDDHHTCEDLYFCDKARDNGFELWVDFSLRCAHISLAFL